MKCVYCGRDPSDNPDALSIVMRWRETRTVEEIATKLGVSVPLVYRWLAKGLISPHHADAIRRAEDES